MALLSIVAAPLASVFWAAIRTAGAAAHRTDGSSIASREIEGMRAVPYAQVGFYDDQGAGSSFEGLTTVSLGPTSPSTGPLIPQIQPKTPDPSAAAGYAPDPDPTNALPISYGGVVYTVQRYVVWANAQDASSTYDKAYKRLTVVVNWSDRAGVHVVRQDSLLYPGGLGKYAGPMGGPAATTTTTVSLLPTAPVLAAIAPLPSPSDQTQVALSWTQPAGGGAVTSYSVEYSTNAGFPAGGFTVIAGLAPSVTNFTVTSLTPGTTYFFRINAYSGSNEAVSSTQSLTTAAAARTHVHARRLERQRRDHVEHDGHHLADERQDVRKPHRVVDDERTLRRLVPNRRRRSERGRRSRLAVCTRRKRGRVQLDGAFVRLEGLGRRPPHLHACGTSPRAARRPSSRPSRSACTVRCRADAAPERSPAATRTRTVSRSSK